MPPHLFAYLDLASGSMIIQAAIAGIVAAPILLRNHIRRFLGRGTTADDAAAEQGLALAPATEVRPDTRSDGPQSDRP